MIDDKVEISVKSGRFQTLQMLSLIETEFPFKFTFKLSHVIKVDLKVIVYCGFSTSYQQKLF